MESFDDIHRKIFDEVVKEINQQIAERPKDKQRIVEIHNTELQHQIYHWLNAHRALLSDECRKDLDETMERLRPMLYGPHPVLLAELAKLDSQENRPS